MTTTTTWHLSDEVPTSAGRVAAGRAGAGQPLVLAHGWPWSSFVWHRVIPLLARSFEVYWYDMPGFGRSEMNPQMATDLGVQGEVFTQVIAHWGLDRPVVWAHDFSGAVTLRAHLLHGQEFDRLLLMNVVAMRPWGSAFFDHVGKHVDAFIRVPAHIHAAIVDAYIKGALITPIAPDDLEQIKAPWLSDAGKVSFYRQFAQADEKYTAELEPMFADVRCPVRVLWGEDDPWIPLARGQALREAIGSASMATLPGVGHLPQLEAHQVTTQLAMPFLTQTSEGETAR